MAQSKDSYSLNHAPLHAGQIADGSLFNTASGLAATDIGFGLGVVRDSSDGKIKLPTGTGQAFAGVVMYELNRALTDAQDSVVPAGMDATIVTLGHVCVVVTESVVIGDDVYLNYFTGKFSKSNSGSDILDSWEFKSAGSALAVIGPKANIVLPTA